MTLRITVEHTEPNSSFAVLAKPTEPGAPEAPAQLIAPGERKSFYISTGRSVVVSEVLISELDEVDQATVGARTKPADVEPIVQFFASGHLPPDLADISRRFRELVDEVLRLPRNAERSVALRKLLEAKDAAVRAKIMVTT